MAINRASSSYWDSLRMDPKMLRLLLLGMATVLFLEEGRDGKGRERGGGRMCGEEGRGFCAWLSVILASDLR